MMSQHITNVFEQIGNFTKNNLGHSSAKHGKTGKDGKTSNHVAASAAAMPNTTIQTSACNKHNVVALKKPLKLRNVASKAESYDSLYSNGIMPTPCNERVCLGSVMAITGRGEEPRPPAEVLSDAKDFLDQYFASIRRANTSAHDARWKTVQTEVEATGTYQLTETELAYGAKLAWRNAARCIGRIQWSKLQVFDCRYVTTTSGMFEALCNHIKYSTNKGNIRSALTVFPQRTDSKHDYRIWNSQLISYAGYKGPDGVILGDPMHVEFTELCIKLGWKPPRTAWDILPLVLSANGKDPDYFDIPRELVLEVHFSHPEFKWFEELNLRWYALPAVSGMRFDCGGIEFTANAFNGWYMSTEIGCRNLCDTKRRNMLETIATRMGLDTRSAATLWRDRALVETNVAVLHSFQQRNVTMVDHHTASDTFLKHLDNENRLRSGCPADWVWIVPPMSSSVTPVFHQEMALYYLRPSYDYQEVPWKTHQWTKGKPGSGGGQGHNKPKRKFNFKQIARAVKFTSKLFGRALSKRIKATVLYATETGRSEQFAKKLGVIFGHAFNAQVYCMEDYDITSIEHEALLLVVTSTFGNGDPPENGEAFAHNLYELRISNTGLGDDSLSVQMPTPKSFIKANSQADLGRNGCTGTKTLSRLESLKGAGSEVETFGPLSNVRFAVFALGSSAYPNFCAFGKYVDNLLGELGGERLLDLATGDELCGQEQSFRKWAASVFNVSCETFCLDDAETLGGAEAELGGTLALTEDTARLMPATPTPLYSRLQAANNRPIIAAKALNIVDLDAAAERTTLYVEFDVDLSYEPGDHVGILACNQSELVQVILDKIEHEDNDQLLELQIQKETHTSNGVVKTWERHERLPPCSLRELFTRFVDITSTPATNLLQYLASTCSDDAERNQLNTLATNPSEYEEWRHYEQSNFPEVLIAFPSCRPSARMLAALLPPLQPRFYSISSSPLAQKGRLYLTVSVVAYKTREGTGWTHYGVCSNYLRYTKAGDTVYMFVRSAPSFHMPSDMSKPMILISPGTGVAPFRGFWLHRQHQLKLLESDSKNKGGRYGDILLIFGCRTKAMDLYREEKEEMLKEGVLTKTFLALSREVGVPVKYVQHVVEQEGAEIYKLISEKGAHFYVCGDVTMAEDVYQTLKGIVKKHGGLKDEDVETFLLSLRDENRYHEDVFGITLRTAEVRNKSRESARMKQARAALTASAETVLKDSQVPAFAPTPCSPAAATPYQPFQRHN